MVNIHIILSILDIIVTVCTIRIIYVAIGLISYVINVTQHKKTGLMYIRTQNTHIHRLYEIPCIAS